MSAIFGLISFDEDPSDSALLKRMDAALAYWGPDGNAVWQERGAGLGFRLRINTPEAAFEKQPGRMADGSMLVAAARLDNRAALLDSFSVAVEERAALPDSKLIERAWLAWGEACVERLYGDWLFAVWQPKEKRLFLARDHFGNTGLYYFANQHHFAFASCKKALLAIDPLPSEIDDLYVAQVLLSWPVYHGERTAYKRIRRLPPAHVLSASPQGVNTRCYWRMEDIPELRLPSWTEYVDGFREVFDEAVRCRLRSVKPVAATLSGGLDSGSVTATAAHLLRAQNKKLIAYTSIPLSDSTAYIAQEQRFGDEWPLASATALCAGPMYHRPIRAEGMTPLAGIERMLWVHDEPQHAAGNAYWMEAMLAAAQADGAGVLLTGQCGNAGISWTGWRTSLPHKDRGRLPSAPSEGISWRKRLLTRFMPHSWALAAQAFQLNTTEPWRTSSSLHPDLARRLHVVESSIYDPLHPSQDVWDSPLDYRLRILMPGRNMVGALWAESGAAYNLEVRDPTIDVRLLSYCLAIPDIFFMDPGTGLDRMIIRAAMQGRLPDEVRLNRKRGRQAADLVMRLRNDRAAMDACLDELACGAAAGYLNLRRIREVWADVLAINSSGTFRPSITILTRGIMAGLFVERF